MATRWLAYDLGLIFQTQLNISLPSIRDRVLTAGKIFVERTAAEAGKLSGKNEAQVIREVQELGLKDIYEIIERLDAALPKVELA